MVIRPEKTAEIELIKKEFASNKAVFFANYRGIGANGMNELRKQLRDCSNLAKVIKLNLARKAASDMPSFVTVTDKMTGPTVMISSNDPAAAAKVVWNYYKKNEVFEVKDGVLEGQVIAPSQIEALSKLPSREVLLAQVLATMQAPSQQFVGVLAAVPRQFLYALNAIKAKKEQETN